MDYSLLAFALVVLVAVATPGPTVLLAFANGSRFGMGGAGFGIAGAALSDLVMITVAALGLGAVLGTSAFWFGVVKWIGVAYLAWLGLQILRSSAQSGPVLTQDQNGLSNPRRKLFGKSFLVAVTNPKGYLFFGAFLPQFVDIATPLAQQYATLAIVFVAIDVAIMLAYAAIGANAGRFLDAGQTHLVDRACGTVLLLLAATLGFMRRVGA